MRAPGPHHRSRPQRFREPEQLRLALRAHRRIQPPHFQSGDFLLIDIWARKDVPNSIWYDITWTGVVNRDPSDHERTVFAIVRDARDAAIHAVREAFESHRPIAGFQADDAAREVIRNAGYGQYFTHRTGHNIAVELHGSGAHLDNLETHDERLILPFTCFSVEPGIYLPEFGIRSEVNMLTTARFRQGHRTGAAGVGENLRSIR